MNALTHWLVPATIENYRPCGIAFYAGAPTGLVLKITGDGKLERGPGFASDDEASVALFEVLSTRLPGVLSELRVRAERAEAELARLKGEIDSRCSHCGR